MGLLIWNPIVRLSQAAGKTKLKCAKRLKDKGEKVKGNARRGVDWWGEEP